MAAAGAAFPVLLAAQVPATTSAPASVVLVPARVFDGQTLQSGWEVVVTGDRIVAAGPAGSDASARPARR